MRNSIIKDIKKSVGFSILADETADISGTEQLSIGARFVDNTDPTNIIIREEFLGYTPLTDMSAASIANAILHQCNTFGLDLNNLLGQGYDGCAAMAGIENGVQAKIKAQYGTLCLS